jgi:IclR family pca regulon transcriptional regulator
LIADGVRAPDRHQKENEIVQAAEEGESGETRRSEQVQSLERGLAVIKAFGKGRERMTIAETARAVGLPRGTAQRFLLTLQQLGYIESDGRYFSLRPRVLELGYRTLAGQSWWPDGQRIVQRIATQLQMPCAVGVLDDMAAVYVCYASAERTALFKRAVGARLPAFASAIGRALLSGLDPATLHAKLASADLPPLTRFTRHTVEAIEAEVEETRRLGRVYVDQELELGLASLGAPIFDREGGVAAGISVSFRPGLADAEVTEAMIIEALQAGASEITRILPA